jgi:diguanylate cyclase (GGDEF)-like protein
MSRKANHRAQPPADTRRPPGALLVVDDEPKVCSGLQRILRKDGYEILIAYDSEQAMDILARQHVDVIISDQRMPGKKGTDWLREVCASYPRTVRMILSGAAEIRDVAEAMGAGVIYKYLTKPIDPALLRANVSEAFSRASALSAAMSPEDTIESATGLPTRTGLQSLFDRFLQRASAESKRVCLLMLAVDQYDNIVSSYGRSFAQRFLNRVAQKLVQVLEGGEILGHDTPGTFVMLISASDPIDRVTFVDHQLDGLLASPVFVDQRSLSVTLSIGATAVEAKLSFDDVIDEAHAAMITGKERGGATIQVYQPHLVAAFRDQLELESDLRRAVAEKPFELYYQPQVDVASGRIVGLEALIRWPHPEHGFVSPAQFIPVAERLGLIEDLGAWVLETAVGQFAAWRSMGHGPEEIAINVSAKQIRDLAFVDRVRAALESSRLSPSNLVLEITESAAIEQSTSISDCLDELRKLGVVLAVDDFGTGYANLGNLTRFAFRKVKIDRSLLPHSPRDERAAGFYKNIVGMAAELGLVTIAEGVETPGELAAVHSAGCGLVQGYFYSPPLKVEELNRLLSHAGTDPSQESRNPKKTRHGR